MTTSTETQNLPSNVPPERVVDFDMFAPGDISNGLQAAWAGLQDAPWTLTYVERIQNTSLSATECITVRAPTLPGRRSRRH